MAQVTSPIILDSTGQQIHSDLQQIKNVLTTPSAAADITFDNTGTGMQADDVQDAITELKSNLSQLDGLTVYKNLTPQTSYADFDDGSTLPLISLTSNIEPTQAGSGDPSPTNIRPISGHTEANVVVSPLNISQLYNGQIYGDGTWLSNPARITNVANAQDNSYFLKKGTYTLDFDVLNQDVRPLNAVSLLTKDENYNIVNNFADSWKSLPFTFTLTQDAYVYFTARCDYININPSDFRAKVLGQTYNIQFKDGDNPLTVYGGNLDVVSGELKVVPYYASYNGETLEGEWISDRDVYAVGTTPTIGAQVVNIGATPTTYQLTPTQVNSLLGHNNIFSDTGNITNVKYLGILNLS